MTGPQRNRIIDLNRQRRQANLDNKSDNWLMIQISTYISAAIVARVKKASKTNTDDDINEDVFSPTNVKLNLAELEASSTIAVGRPLIKIIY